MPNHEHVTTPENNVPIQEIERKISDSISQEIGAKVLAHANLQDRHPVIEKSFNRAIKQGEKLPGKNGERRNLAHIRRLERVIERGGSETEKYLWDRAKEHIHLVETKDITDATWRSIQQDNRDHGGGNVELTTELKDLAAEQYRSVQEQDLQNYVDYFSAKECPYPTWFKVYAWDGLTSLSRSTKQDKDGRIVLQKRDKTTTSGFPKLNPAALAKTYDAITEHYGLKTDAKEASQSTPETDQITKQLVQSGNFAKLYSYELSTLIKPVEVPDNPEDVHGEWREYGLDQVGDISDAAEGTPWCIVSPSVARNYLLYGSYGEASRYEEAGNESKAKFVLFHLTDPETGLPSEQACASIRLNPNGEVEEISGTLGGSNQALHDSLVEIVRNKAMQYPGGERMFQAFQDNLELIRLDKKFQNGEPFTEEELDFIFETNREIEQLNPYNRDDRISELRDIDKILENGADIDTLTAKLDPYTIAKNLGRLLAAGAEIDVNDLVSKLDPDDIAYEIDGLLAAGAEIDVNDLVSKLDPYDIAKNLDKLLVAGADVNIIIDNLDPTSTIRLSSKLLAAGADVKDIISKLDPYEDVAENINILLNAGADIKDIISELNPYSIGENINILLNAGADIKDLLNRFDSYHLANYDFAFKAFLEAGANMNDLINKLNPFDIKENYEYLIDAGADEELLRQRLNEQSE